MWVSGWKTGGLRSPSTKDSASGPSARRAISPSISWRCRHRDRRTVPDPGPCRRRNLEQVEDLITDIALVVATIPPQTRMPPDMRICTSVGYSVISYPPVTCLNLYPLVTRMRKPRVSKLYPPVGLPNRRTPFSGFRLVSGVARAGQSCTFRPRHRTGRPPGPRSRAAANQMRGQLTDRRVVEHRRRADVELPAELAEQPVAELDGHQRVGAEIQETGCWRPGLCESQKPCTSRCRGIR